MPDFAGPLATADDDSIYPRRWLEGLIKAYRRDPMSIHCYRAHALELVPDGIQPYLQWKECKSTNPSFLHFCTGVSGALYPPGFLEFLKHAGRAFLDLCPGADDVWLNVNALRSGYRVRQVGPRPVLFPHTPYTQNEALWRTNRNAGQNDVQIRQTYAPADLALLRTEAEHGQGELDATIEDSLLVSCLGIQPDDGGLLLIHKGKIHILDCHRTSGLDADGSRVIRALQFPDRVELIVYSIDGHKTKIRDDGYRDVHDVRLLGGKLFIVSTGTNEVVELSDDWSVQKRWRFPCEGIGDSWHLNCLDVWNGRLVVSAFGEFTRHREWKGREDGAGFVIDLETGERLWEGLTGPHHPRVDPLGRKLVCDSMANRLLIDPGNGPVQSRAFGRFTRGIAFGKKRASAQVGPSAGRAYLGLTQDRTMKKMTEAGEGWLLKGSIVILNAATLAEVGRVDLPFGAVYEIVPVSDEMASALLRHQANPLLSAILLHYRFCRNTLHLVLEKYSTGRKIRSLIRWFLGRS